VHRAKHLLNTDLTQKVSAPRRRIQGRGMKLLISALWMVLVTAAQTQAQDNAWLQIDAQPTEAEAEESAQYYESFLPDVAGFALASGWYVIALGPYSEITAQNLLQVYRDSGQVPADSFTSYAQDYAQQFWPLGEDLLTAPEEITITLLPEPIVVPTPEPIVVPTPEAPAAPEALVEPEPPAVVSQTPTPQSAQTLIEARNSESLMSRDERKQLQRALSWADVYKGDIDGQYGPMSRRSMKAWQNANTFAPTGVLTLSQRNGLLADYRFAVETIGLQTVQDMRAGISVMMPLAQLSAAQYTYPFARYAQRDGEQAGALLISQEGDRATLNSLYKIMQTLDSIPSGGERVLQRDNFVINSQNDAIISHTQARLTNGEIKGFTLVWPRSDTTSYEMILSQMQSSFTPIEGILKPSDTALGTVDNNLLSGFEILRPKHSRSGIFVADSGLLLTTIEAVEGCSSLTIDRDFSAEVTATDPDLGLVLVTPKDPLSPIAIGRFSTLPARLGEDIIVSGYSFEGVLDTPSLTSGTVTDDKGLNGETNLLRLTLPAMAGDAGGPVLSAGGTVLGMLQEPHKGARKLPEDVSFAVTAEALVALLERSGIWSRKSETTSPVANAARAQTARDITALVDCWG
jgi:S1-C subfamily serine protease